MAEIRMKWSEELEQLLECPVCYERLSTCIWMCPTGHAICSICIKRIRMCVTCKQPYVNTRNFLAESIATKIDSVKTKLMDMNLTTDIKPNTRTYSVACQTDFDPMFSAMTHDPRLFKDFVVPQGKFPCWIGYECNFQGYFNQIIEHAEKKHPFEFEEHTDQGTPHTKTWEFDYNFPSRLNRLFRVPNFGLFVLHIDISIAGEVRAYIFMYNSGIKSKEYAYQIVIECDGLSSIYIGDMDTCRIPKHALMRTGLAINFSDEIIQRLIMCQKFSCSLIIEKQIETAAALSKMKLAQIRNDHRSDGRNSHGMQPEFSQSGAHSLL